MPEGDRDTVHLYAALTRASGAILRARSRDALLHDVCEAWVEQRAAECALVLWLDGGVLRPRAYAGIDEATLDALRASLERSGAEGPLGTALRTGKREVARGTLGRDTPESTRAPQRAFAVLPLQSRGDVAGALCLQFADARVLDDAALALLDELAADVSYALDTLDRDAARLDAVRAAETGFERFQKIFHATPVPTVISTLDDGRLLAVNDAYCRLMGVRREELVGRTAHELGAWREPGARDEFIRALLREHRVRDREVQMRTVDGRVRDISFSAELIEFEGRPCMLAILNDVTDRKRFESRIEFLATHDGLTELPNRTLMLDRMGQALQHARRAGRKAAVLYVDLDRFKVLNEALGQRGGDQVLAEVATRLKSVVRDGDTVARFSGDEFVVLVPDLEKLQDCYSLVQRLLSEVGAPMTVDGRSVHVKASVGISIFPTDGDTPEALLRNAEVAMLRAKRTTPGAGQFFTPEMSAELSRLAQLEAQLAGAVAAHQMRLLWQPKVELAGGTIAGVEALLRWEHPELGDVPPGTFIPVAEEAGAIVPIGACVLRSACAQNMAWQAAGLPPLPISVNVSARQFVQPDLVPIVAAALEATGMPGHLLELEITETAIARNAERMIDIMSLLRELGVRFSIDDFGTGYSNLGYLKRFQLDRLKIDQSFVRNVDTDSGDAAIALAVISLARSLQLEVTAEGVENAAQYAFMKQHTCDEIQGFYFSRPVGADAFAAMVREGRRLR